MMREKDDCIANLMEIEKNPDDVLKMLEPPCMASSGICISESVSIAMQECGSRNRFA